MSESPADIPPPWWGTYPLRLNEGARWALGPIQLGAEHLPGEVRLSWGTEGVPELREIATAIPSEGTPHAPDATLARFPLSGADASITLRPALPDRAVVARPDTTLWVLAQQRIDLFVSVPLWVDISLTADAAPVQSLASVRLSDTWFGPSPRQGELCYSSRTQARLDVTKFPQHPIRAVTRVTIDNCRPTAVRVDRLKLPAPLLGLYATPDHRFWTSSVELKPTDGDSATHVHLRPPKGLADDRFERITPARRHQTTNAFERALSALIG